MSEQLTELDIRLPSVNLTAVKLQGFIISPYVVTSMWMLMEVTMANGPRETVEISVFGASPLESTTNRIVVVSALCPVSATNGGNVTESRYVPGITKTAIYCGLTPAGRDLVWRPSGDSGPARAARRTPTQR